MIFVAIGQGYYVGQDGFAVQHPSKCLAHATYEGQVIASFRRTCRGVSVSTNGASILLAGLTVLSAAMAWCAQKAVS